MKRPELSQQDKCSSHSVQKWASNYRKLFGPLTSSQIWPIGKCEYPTFRQYLSPFLSQNNQICPADSCCLVLLLITKYVIVAEGIMCGIAIRGLMSKLEALIYFELIQSQSTKSNQPSCNLNDSYDSNVSPCLKYFPRFHHVFMNTINT